MKWNNKYKNTLQTLSNLFVKWENQQMIGKKNIKKKKKVKQKKSPSWLGPLSRYYALPTELWGTCHAWKENLKIIYNKWSSYCKEQMH